MSFWIGVPVRMTLRGVLSASNITEVLLFADLSLWPDDLSIEAKLANKGMRSRKPSSQTMRPIGGLEFKNHEFQIHK